jgi:hypothetical protein
MYSYTPNEAEMLNNKYITSQLDYSVFFTVDLLHVSGILSHVLGIHIISYQELINITPI